MVSNPPLVRGGTREDGETLAPPLARGAGGALSQQPGEALDETLTPPLARGAGGAGGTHLIEHCSSVESIF